MNPLWPEFGEIPPKEAIFELTHGIISCWLGRDGHMQKGEGVCVFQSGNTMFRRVTFALATLCLQEKHIFGDTAWAFAAQ